MAMSDPLHSNPSRLGAAHVQDKRHSDASSMTLAPENGMAQPSNLNADKVSDDLYRSAISPSRAPLSGPPPLPYSLHEHKKGIIIGFTSLLVISCASPILIYFLLSRFTNLDISIVFTVITCVPLIQLFDYGIRTYRLTRPDKEGRIVYRPIDSPRWRLDFYHWSYTIGVCVITSFFSAGAGNGDITLVGLPLPFLMAMVGLEVVTANILFHFGVRAPIQMSSVPAGSKIRAPLYYIIEDIVAVNGRGGQEYRRAWFVRYEKSPVMQRMLGQLSWFWGVPAALIGMTLFVLLATINQEIAYGLAWTVPWVWVAIWTPITISWVRRGLAEEKRTFAAGQV